ncbi:MAG TPA: hypothetical protein VM841_00875 [Actinomycetota bacterium]|nr:hypothetical protein [Actinomycetota bacterium]
MADLSFETDIKPLFRDKDRQAMMFAFDLHEYASVRDNAADILAEVESGNMPCDAPWAPEQVETFRAWKDGGASP